MQIASIHHASYLTKGIFFDHGSQLDFARVQIEGRGNGIKTNVVNNVEIAKALERPPDCGHLLQYLPSHSPLYFAQGYMHVYRVLFILECFHLKLWFP